jgi:NTE family protein
LRKYDQVAGFDQDYRQWLFNLDKAISSGPNTLVLAGATGARWMNRSGDLQLRAGRRAAAVGLPPGLDVRAEHEPDAHGLLPPPDATRLPAAGLPVVHRRSLERGRAWNNDNEFDSGYINAASIFLGLDTPLGPLNFSYGTNDANEQAVYLNLGHTF